MFLLRFYGKEGNVLFKDALNTFYLRLYGLEHMVNNRSESEREETRCHHMGYSVRLAARVPLYVPSHRQDRTYHSLCYTSRGALAGMRFHCSQKYIHEKYERRNVISFNNALNTFNLWLYGVNHMVKDHKDSQRKPAAATTWAILFD